MSKKSNRTNKRDNPMTDQVEQVEAVEAVEGELVTMPTVAHKVALHFKNLVIGRDDDKIADLKHVCEVVEHVKFENTVNLGKNDVEQACIKRASEEYTVLTPDFNVLLGEFLEDVDGLDKKQAVRVQELVAKHIDDFARRLVDGAVVRDSEGVITGIEGFQQVTSANCSFALASLESLGRKASGAKQTVPVAVRDAGIALLTAFLTEAAVNEKGVKLITAAAKSYFSPAVIAQLPPEALEIIKGRIESWHAVLEDAHKEEYGLLYSRWMEKLDKAINPDEMDIAIF